MSETTEVGAPRRTGSRDLSIQALRGLAVFLMVAGHVIGTASDRGMNVSDDSIWRFFYLGLEDIRMPLFTVISGYVYAIRPVERQDGIPQLLRGKVRRLIIPLLTVGALLFITKLVVPETNVKPEFHEFWRVYLYGYEHLWFLQSIFLIFVTAAALGALGCLRTAPRWAACTTLTLILFVFVRVPDAGNIFSINGAIRLMPFFLIGYGMYRFGFFHVTGWKLLGVTTVFAGIYSIRLALIINDSELDDVARRAVSLIVGLCGIVLIYSLRKLIAFRWLGWVGGFSFGIYLLHVFGSAGARIALSKVGIDWDPAVFVVSLAIGVSAPIIFQLLFGKWNFVRTLLLGEKPKTDSQVKTPQTNSSRH